MQSFGPLDAMANDLSQAVSEGSGSESPSRKRQHSGDDDDAAVPQMPSFLRPEFQRLCAIHPRVDRIAANWGSDEDGTKSWFLSCLDCPNARYKSSGEQKPTGLEAHLRSEIHRKRSTIRVNTRGSKRVSGLMLQL